MVSLTYYRQWACCAIWTDDNLSKKELKMTVETKRLVIHTASEAEMRSLLAQQTDKELIKAYGEMLQGSLEKRDQDTLKRCEK